MARPGIEEVVLLDESGAATAAVPKADVHTADTPLHLAFSCWIADPHDRVLLTRRAPGKTFAGVWTNAVCGHPAPGESLPDAVRRRCRDELGLPVDEVSLIVPGFRYRAEQDGILENEICPVVLVRVPAGTTIRPDPGEVSDHRWVSWRDLSADIPARARELSVWAGLQLQILGGLGAAPSRWPPGDPDQLPPALRIRPDTTPARGAS